MIDTQEHNDNRGNLSVVDFRNLPFQPVRAFWITNVPKGEIRGGHAHSQCAEVIFPLKGAFDIFIDDHNTQQTFHLDNPNQGIHVGKNVWCRLSNFTSDAIALVFASTPYMKDGYINNYEDFKKQK